MKSNKKSGSALVVGASGGIGSALVDLLHEMSDISTIYAASRKPQKNLPGECRNLAMDIEDEQSIAKAANAVAEGEKLRLIIVASGVLHDSKDMMPEKRLAEIDPTIMSRAFAVNAIGPTLVLKHFYQLMPADSRCVFAALSARVGSIRDNRLGGWYSYRASKAALNMLLRTGAIELARVKPQAICVGLHPGTVDTALSAPFKKGLPRHQLLDPQQAAQYLLAVISRLTVKDSGRVFAWDGHEVPS